MAGYNITDDDIDWDCFILGNAIQFNFTRWCLRQYLFMIAPFAFIWDLFWSFILILIFIFVLIIVMIVNIITYLKNSNK